MALYFREKPKGSAGEGGLLGRDDRIRRRSRTGRISGGDRPERKTQRAACAIAGGLADFLLADCIADANDHRLYEPRGNGASNMTDIWLLQLNRNSILWLMRRRLQLPMLHVAQSAGGNRIFMPKSAARASCLAGAAVLKPPQQGRTAGGESYVVDLSQYLPILLFLAVALGAVERVRLSADDRRPTDRRAQARSRKAQRI